LTGIRILDELEAFRLEVDCATDSKIGHPGRMGSRAWGILRGECMQNVRDAGGTLRLLQSLFEEGNGAPDADQKKDKIRKRLARAKKRGETKG